MKTWFKGIMTGAIVVLAAAPAQADSLWRWSATPYIWAAGVKVDTDVNDEPVLGADVSFKDLLEDTDLAAMGHFEGRKGRQGFFVDILFLGTSDESTSAARPPLPDGTRTASDLDSWLAEVGGIWHPTGEEHGFELIYGARLLDFDLETEVELPSPSAVETTIESSKSYLDGFGGVRWSAPFAKRWDIMLRGDVGTGGTDFSWNAVATLGVSFDEKEAYSLRFGYRHAAFNLEDDDDVTVESDVVYSGPFVGFTFAWGGLS